MSLINLSNIESLLRRDFILSKKKYIIGGIIFSSAIILAFIFNRLSLSLSLRTEMQYCIKTSFHFATVYTIIFALMGILFLGNIINKQSLMNLLMLPVTRLEYFTSRIIICTTSFLSYILIYLILDYLYVAASPLWMSDSKIVLQNFSFSDLIASTTSKPLYNGSYMWQNSGEFWNTIAVLFGIQGYIAFMSVLFPIKTIQKILLFNLALALGVFILLVIISTIFNFEIQDLTNLFDNSSDSGASKYIVPIMFSATGLLFWVLSYYRFKKLEIINRL